MLPVSHKSLERCSAFLYRWFFSLLEGLWCATFCFKILQSYFAGFRPGDIFGQAIVFAIFFIFDFCAVLGLLWYWKIPLSLWCSFINLSYHRYKTLTTSQRTEQALQLKAWRSLLLHRILGTMGVRFQCESIIIQAMASLTKTIPNIQTKFSKKYMYVVSFHQFENYKQLKSLTYVTYSAWVE